MSEPSDTPPQDEAAASTEPSSALPSSSAPPLSSPPEAHADEAFSPDELGADGLPVADVPAAPAAPRRTFREWLFRSRELADKRAAIEGDSARMHAVRRGRAALVHAGQALHPVVPPRDGGSASISLGLAIEGLVWALAAQRGAGSHEVGTDAAAALEAADPAVLRALVEREADLAVLRRVAAESFVARAERSEAEVAQDAETVRRVANELLHVATAPRRELDAIRAARVGRLGTLLAIVGLVFFGGYKGVVAATLPPDLAKGRPWSASSSYPNFSAAEHTCDGTETFVLFHTREEENPWFQIDLGTAQTVKRLDVRNRMDGLRERAVPLVAEISENGRDWKEVARRTAVFDTWTAKFTPVKARYVRLKVQRRTFLHLEQVAVR